MENESSENKNSFIYKFKRVFRWFEVIVSFAVSLILGCILLVMVLRLADAAYSLVFSKFAYPKNISSSDVSNIFGKILSLLITLEFLNSIIRGIKGKGLEGPVKDVTLITALAIARKMILTESELTTPEMMLASAASLIALGGFYYILNKVSNKKASPLQNGDISEGMKVNRK